jgi:hypothetical protein
MRDTASHSREQFVANPLNSFLLIKKLTSEWKELQGLIQGGPGERLLQNITQEKQNIGLRWPSDEDLNGAAVGKDFSSLKRKSDEKKEYLLKIIAVFCHPDISLDFDFLVWN